MITQQQVIDFLTSRDDLKIASIEQKAGIPTTTLTYALKGRRKLKLEYLQRLEPILVGYGLNTTPTTLPSGNLFRAGRAHVISIVNHKGGVGKTTTTINLGGALSRMGYRVLVIDSDSQGNLSQSLGIDEPSQQLLHALQLKNRIALPIHPITETFALVPSDLELASFERDLLNSATGTIRLKAALEPVLTVYDFIIIDCPPALNVFTNAALIASNSVLVVIEPEISAAKGLFNIYTLVAEITELVNRELKLDGILFTKVNSRLAVHRAIISRVKEESDGVHCFETMIRLNTAIKESQYAQTDVLSYSKSSAGAADYEAFAQEYINHLRAH